MGSRAVGKGKDVRYGSAEIYAPPALGRSTDIVLLLKRRACAIRSCDDAKSRCKVIAIRRKAAHTSEPFAPDDACVNGQRTTVLTLPAAGLGRVEHR